MHLNVLSPSLILNAEEIDRIVVTLGDSISAVMADLKTENLWSV